MPLKGGVAGWKGVYHLEGRRCLLGRMSELKLLQEHRQPTFSYDQLVLGANWMIEYIMCLHISGSGHASCSSAMICIIWNSRVSWRWREAKVENEPLQIRIV